MAMPLCYTNDTAEPHWAFRSFVQAQSLHYMSVVEPTNKYQTNVIMLEIYDVIYFLKNFGRFGRVYGKEFVGVCRQEKDK